MFIQRLCFVFRYIKIPHTGHFCFLDLYEGILLLFFSRSASCKPSSDGFNIYFYNFRNILNTHFPVSERIFYIFLLVHSCFIAKLFHFLLLSDQYGRSGMFLKSICTSLSITVSSSSSIIIRRTYSQAFLSLYTFACFYYTASFIDASFAAWSAAIRLSMISSRSPFIMLSSL